MASKIEFHGDGPFDLPVSQNSRVDANEETVTITFRVLVESNQDRSQLASVRIAILNNQARELAAAILAALPKGL
jgi:hypothetical protein